MIPHLAFVWFFSFSSTSYVVPVVLYNAKKVSYSNMHIENKNQNVKRRIETKNIYFLIFELKIPRTLILWRRLVLWIKMAATLASHVLVIIFVNLMFVNFKNFTILVWNIWVIYGSWKSWGSAVFDSKHQKQFIIHSSKLLNLIPDCSNMVKKINCFPI